MCVLKALTKKLGGAVCQLLLLAAAAGSVHELNAKLRIEVPAASPILAFTRAILSAMPSQMSFLEDWVVWPESVISAKVRCSATFSDKFDCTALAGLRGAAVGGTLGTQRCDGGRRPTVLASRQ
mmetsp:Transcript_85010/g.168724  ORF Transcript_85010/g.168724 Transcript_85010/m.168724 type:complete len:124 (+) Transcript_85010:759-1130(+)